MPHSWLECDSCKSRFDIMPLFFGCPVCTEQRRRRPLEMKYDARTLNADHAQSGLWRWKNLLPPVEPQHRLSLGEGGTPLLSIAMQSSRANVYLKNETSNPTWSWKDRPNAVSVSMARQLGFARVVAKSTGNHGNSMAAYAARGGLQSTVLCNRDAPKLQLALMSGYGARVIRGGNQDAILSELVRRQNYFPCTILCPQSGVSNPYGIEGFKTIAFEIVDALDGRAPDRVFVPVGSGDGIYGIWKGFRELAERKIIPFPPRMIGCQAEGANSASIAWRGRQRKVEALPSVRTVALSVAELATGNHALRAVYESDGSIMEESDGSILQAAKDLRKRGLALEPASSLSFACAHTSQGGEGETWVLIGSGSAAKWPETLLQGFEVPSELPDDITDLPDLVPTPEQT